MVEYFEMPSISSSMNKLEFHLSKLLDRSSTCPDFFGNVLVALMEGVHNAIKHGNNYDARKLVKIRMESSEEYIIITICDEGRGFSPHEPLRNPCSSEHIHECNGRGLYLMRHLADEIQYQDEGRIVTLKFSHIQAHSN